MSEIVPLAALLLRVAGAAASLAGVPQVDLSIQALEQIGKTLNGLVADANKALGIAEELKQLELELREATARERAKNDAKRAAKLAVYDERRKVAELESRANELRRALAGEKAEKALPYVPTSARKLTASSKVVSFADESAFVAAVAADAADAAAAPATAAAGAAAAVPRIPPGAVAVIPSALSGGAKPRSIIVKMKEARAAKAANKAGQPSLKKSGSGSGDTASREDPAESK
jgi:hypothetical protein